MGKKVVKKVDPKKVAKGQVMKTVVEALEAAGVTVLNGVDFGFTEGTIVIRTEKCDVQLKPITPKAGLDFYESAVEDEVEDAPVEAETETLEQEGV